MPDLKCLLCPTDFSETSRHAVDCAVVLARWYGARVVGLHVFNPAFAPVPGFELAGYGSAAAAREIARRLDPAALQADVRAALADAARAGVEIDAAVRIGKPAAQIVEYAASLPADLIVMGTHGAGGFERFVLGSVTEKVLRQARCPVLTVPPRAHATSALPFKRLLCPVDFSDASLAALRFALSLAQEGDAGVTIVHVLEWPLDGDALTSWPLDVAAYRVAREREAEVQLQALVPEQVRDWCEPRVRLGHGKPYREILGMAAEEQADLIVMGVHGRNALDRMLFGSTANHVVRRATCPVLTLRT